MGRTYNQKEVGEIVDAFLYIEKYGKPYSEGKIRLSKIGIENLQKYLQIIKKSDGIETHTELGKSFIELLVLSESLEK